MAGPNSQENAKEINKTLPTYPPRKKKKRKKSSGSGIPREKWVDGNGKGEEFIVHDKFSVSQVCHNWTAHSTSRRETKGLRQLNPDAGKMRRNRG